MARERGRFSGFLLLGSALLFLGAVMFVLAGQSGQASAGLVLIFPVITGSGPFALAGTLAFGAGVFLVFLGLARHGVPRGLPLPIVFVDSHPTRPKKRRGPGSPGRAASPVKGAGVVLIGPIPVVVGSDRRLALLLVVFTFGIMLLAVLLMIVGSPHW